MGPASYGEKLPMVSNGPIEAIKNVADSVRWAQQGYGEKLPMVSNGPIEAIKNVANGVRWAH